MKFEKLIEFVSFNLSINIDEIIQAVDGIMIARGDLAIETGWKNFAIIQEEILSICEAAHIPDIWATQVLENLAKKLPQWELKGGAVLACSALKESYREILMSETNNIKWVYLNGSFEIITERLSKRTNHFMKMDLLKSQFDTLEPPTYGLHIDIKKEPTEINKSMMR